tara:strand:- start:6450 stop:6926 length:477 start_codon:yes stop_codon:yes gene_type:complete
MNKFINIFFLILCLNLTSNCGFKIIDQKKKSNFNIEEINTYGNKRINFKIKNNLLLNSKNNDENLLIIDLKTKKIKKIKEKNIKNEITKYQITINSLIKLNSLKNNKIYEFGISTVGDFLVANNNSTTVNNEKKLVDNLVEQVSDNIINEIIKKLNDN